MQIKDGTGSGLRAQVDQFNRLRVFNTMTTQEHHAVTINVGFITSVALSGVRRLTCGVGFDGYIMYLRNANPTRFMNIQKMVFTADTSGVIFTLVRNPVLGTLANNNTVTPANLNFGSQNPALAQAEVWDEVSTGIGGLSGGIEIDSFVIRDEALVLPVDGSMTIPNNNSIGIRAQNTGGGGVEVTASIRNFFEG